MAKQDALPKEIMELDHFDASNQGGSPPQANKTKFKENLNRNGSHEYKIKVNNNSFDEENIDQSQDIENRVKFQYQEDDTDGRSVLEPSDRDMRESQVKFNDHPTA